MKKFALKAAGMFALSALASCGGGWSSAIDNTGWTSMTITPQQMTNGVTASTYVVHFGMHTTSTPGASGGGTAVGPFTATLTQVYGASGGSLSGCTEVTNFTAAVWNDTGSATDQTMGGIDITGSEVSATTRTGCTDTTENGTDSSTSRYTNTGGNEAYTIVGMMMTTTGNSMVPFYPATYTFTKNATP